MATLLALARIKSPFGLYIVAVQVHRPVNILYGISKSNIGAATPITLSDFCVWARAPSGHVIAKPAMVLTKSRRRITFSKALDRAYYRSHCRDLLPMKLVAEKRAEKRFRHRFVSVRLSVHFGSSTAW